MFFYPDPTPEISRAGGNDEEKIKRSVRLALLKTYGVLPALAGILWERGIPMMPESSMDKPFFRFEVVLLPLFLPSQSPA